jgi:hypothetical protein
LQFATVPCLVHDLTDAEAAVLAAADNVRVASPSTGDSRPGDVPGVRQLMTTYVSSIRGCADMCQPATGGLQRQALDLLKAHAWRASRVLDALNLIARGPCAAPRERALATIIDEVIEGFATESRLSGVPIRADITEHLSSAGLNDAQIVTGLSGALLAVLPLVEHAARPAVVIKASNTNGSEAVIELIQNCVPVAPRIADDFFHGDPSMDRLGDYAAVIGALAAKALADAHGGYATFEQLPQGSRLAIVMKRRS